MLMFLRKCQPLDINSTPFLFKCVCLFVSVFVKIKGNEYG